MSRLLPVEEEIRLAQSSNRTKKWRSVWVALVILMVCAIWLVRQETAAPVDSRPTETLAQTVDSLWGWTDPWLQGGAQSAEWSMRWDGRAGVSEIKALAQRLELPPMSGTTEGLVTRRQQGSASWTLWHAETENSEPEAPQAFVLVLETKSGLSRQELLKQARFVEEPLERLREEETWSLSFRGTAQVEDAAERIAEAAGASLQERYEDNGSSSSTYYTDRLGRSAFSGEAQINLQLATHYDRLTGSHTIAGGIPLITGDYSPRSR
ncbi:YwmB family TATA-box binding protein [Paenibacillus daejeonensis]|uniref:YwmB family TATA-box binding protein n=1 Tax=Paenibacillus daejeonensis TaxID=135193 RepID=UPI00036FBE2C|nr:YwmB family TATA-box binding protein [Paenibacillus daejeonensis]